MQAIASTQLYICAAKCTCLHAYTHAHYTEAADLLHDHVQHRQLQCCYDSMLKNNVYIEQYGTE